MNISLLVKNIIKKHKTRNPFQIASDLNIGIFICNLDKLRGFYRNYERTFQICINENLTKIEQNSVCAHELGHYFIHKKYNTVFLDTGTFFIHNKIELQANLFAAELLIDDNNLKNYEDYSLEQIAMSESVSIELVKCKLNFF